MLNEMERAADMEADEINDDEKGKMVFHECGDTTVNNLMRKFSDRAIKSNHKHGNTINQVNKNQIEWAVEALEEAMDMCVYLQRLIEMMLEERNVEL